MSETNTNPNDDPMMHAFSMDKSREVVNDTMSTATEIKATHDKHAKKYERSAEIAENHSDIIDRLSNNDSPYFPRLRPGPMELHDRPVETLEERIESSNTQIAVQEAKMKKREIKTKAALGDSRQHYEHNTNTYVQAAIEDANAAGETIYYDDQTFAPDGSTSESADH